MQAEQAGTFLYARHSWLLPSCSHTAPKVVDVVAVVDVVVVDVVELVVVDDVVVVVVVVPATHWLSVQTLPGSKSPHWIGVPQPLSIEPHCALSAGQSCAAQHCPNLSVGWMRMQSLLAQLLCTWHVAPSRLPP